MITVWVKPRNPNREFYIEIAILPLNEEFTSKSNNLLQERSWDLKFDFEVKFSISG